MIVYILFCPHFVHIPILSTSTENDDNNDDGTKKLKQMKVIVKEFEGFKRIYGFEEIFC